jgi:hypothetical protein
MLNEQCSMGRSHLALRIEHLSFVILGGAGQTGGSSLKASLPNHFGIQTVAGYVLAMPKLERITLDPAVMGGKPCIRGLRVTVGTIVGLIAAGKTRDESWGFIPISSRETSMKPWPTRARSMKNRRC